MRILILAGKSVDTGAIASLLGDSEYSLARHASVSRGVRHMEKELPDLAVVIPDKNDTTWDRAIRRIRREFDIPAILIGHAGNDHAEASLAAGAYDYFELDASAPMELQRSLLHLETLLAAERRLAKLQHKLDWIEKTGRFGSWEMPTDGKAVWSKGFRHIVESGGRKLDKDFASVRQFVHPEDLEIFDQANKATFDEGWPLDFEYRMMDDAGKARHLHLHRRVEVDSNGEITRVYGMARDITPQKEFEHFLFRRDAILQVVGAFAGIFLRESNWESSIDDALKELGKAADVTRAFVLGKDSPGTDDLPMSMQHEWTAPGFEPIINSPKTQGQPFAAVYERWKEALTRHKVIAGHVRNFQKNEREVFGFADVKSIMLVPVFVGTEWWGFIGFSEHREEREWAPVELESMTMVSDIFGSAILRRRMEDLLVEANRSAEEAKTIALDASQAKSRFLANMSHEIRTPISGILGMTEMTITTGLTPEQREHMHMIRDAARSLLAIVNDVLDISKIEAEKMELSPEDFLLREEIDTLVRPFALRAEQKGVVFLHRIDDTVPDYIHGDPDRLGQILRNLMDNALKFTERGLIELIVKTTEKTDNRTCLRFTVRDTGEGIPQNKLATIFESFTQADISTHKTHQGTGLGLTISKELVHMMDGEIDVESTIDQGSSFSFTAWFDAVQTAPKPATAPTDTPATLHLRILLAEDNPLNQKFLTHFLTMFGHTVTVAENGVEALEKLDAMGREIDIVLMDIQMPQMGGIETTTIVRKSDGTRYDPDIPIIALTAYAMKGDRERMLAAGMNDYISKPVDMKRLSATIARTMADRDQPPTAEPVSTPAMGECIPVELDMEALINRFEGNTELLKDILELFLIEADDKLKKLDASVATANTDDLGMAMHSITNIASHVLAMDIVNRARSLEKFCYLGKTDEALTGAAELRPRFVGLIKAVAKRNKTL